MNGVDPTEQEFIMKRDCLKNGRREVQNYYGKKDMGDGYSSATVTDDAVYVTGRKDSSDVLTALTLDGKKKWETVYGKAWMTNHTGSRCIPTYYNGNIFLISGSGDIVCVGSDGKIKWSKNHYSLYDSKPIEVRNFRISSGC